MSGGSLNYAYEGVKSAAEHIRAWAGSRGADPALLRAFADHLDKVSEAMHDAEWFFSCDYGWEQAAPAIRAVLSPRAIVESARAHAEAVLAELRAACDLLAQTVAVSRKETAP